MTQPIKAGRGKFGVRTITRCDSEFTDRVTERAQLPSSPAATPAATDDRDKLDASQSNKRPRAGACPRPQ
eukprot:scaffold77723_cov37-Tisochrysis_lutea.AAC.1